MAGLTQARQMVHLDQEFPVTGATDAIGYSTNGTSESGALVRTPVGATGWLAATAATPSIKANGTDLLSAKATAPAKMTHWAVFSAPTGGFQKIDWTLLAEEKDMVLDDQLIWAAGTCQITLD